MTQKNPSAQTIPGELGLSIRENSPIMMISGDIHPHWKALAAIFFEAHLY
jgi:hypothetical protein